MSAGLSFGALPSFADLSPDQQAMVMQSLQARAAEQQQPGSPDQLLFNRAGMGGQAGFQPQGGPDDAPPTTGSTGREAHQSAPAIAMDEAAVQRMEQPMLPPVAGGNVPPVPQAAPSTQGGPVPPAMQQPTPGAQPAPQAAPQMAPVNSFDPLTGQPTSGTPKPITPAGAAQASGQAGGGSFLEKFANNLNNPQIGNLLFNAGIGLMSKRGIGEGLAAGLSNYQTQQGGNLQQQLQQIKFMQEQQNLAATKKYLSGKGLSPDAVEAAAGNPAILSALQTQMNQQPSAVDVGGKRYWLKPGEAPTPDKMMGDASAPPSGFQPAPNGALAPTTGGPQDPAYQAAVAKAKDDAVGNKPMNIRPGGVVLDPNTREVLYQAPSDKPVGFDQEEKLRNDFTKQQANFNTVHNAYGSIVAATQDRQNNPGKVSPAADMSLIFGYMKMLDPGSVVREGEYATAQNATGVPDRVLNSYNKLINGESLNDEQRRDFLDQAQKLYGQQRKNAEGLQEHYKGLATQYGLEPERVARLPDAPQAPKIPTQGMASPKTQADFEALPRGSIYIDPQDGKKYRK